MLRTLCAALLGPLALSSCASRDGDLPAVYLEMEVPVERLASPDLQRQGRALFHEHCILCHGDRADGQGVRASAFQPPPRDLTNAAWQRATDDRHLYYIIAEGRTGTAMPSWKPTLSRGEVWSIVSYLRSLAPPPAAGSESGSAEGAPSASSGPRR